MKRKSKREARKIAFKKKIKKILLKGALRVLNRKDKNDEYLFYIISKYLRQEKESKISLESIQKQIICDAFNINPDDLFKRIRKSEIIEARHFFWWYKITKEGYGPNIAEKYGFDHATAIYAKKSINNFRETNKEFFKKTKKALIELGKIKNINHENS